MTSLLTTMRQSLADAENDAERLRSAIAILEQADASTQATRRARTARRPAGVATASAAPAIEPPKAQTNGAPATRKRKPAARKPAKSVVPLEKLLKVVGDKPGLTTTAIAKETGGEQSALLELLKESEQKGEVRRQGERRATSWYRITDEDRIAARAAEIAAQSGSAGAKGSASATRRKP
jgi:hypothetical protein